MRVPTVRSALAPLLVLGLARALGAQAAPAPARGSAATSPADPAATRARSEAFRDTVDGALDRAFREDEGAERHPGLARRLAGGFSISASQPLGDLRRGGRVGVGVAGFASISADPAGVLGLRLEGGTQNYGTTSLRSASNLGFFATNLRQITTNNIFWLGVGPQVTIPLGPVRPYGFATVGGANFSTNTRLQYSVYGDPYGAGREFQATDLSNWAFARAAGGGLRVRIGGASRRAAFVDLGARWQRVNNVRFLVPGAIPTDVDPNTLALSGRPNFVTYHLGISLAGR